jgi:hypothetical protein
MTPLRLWLREVEIARGQLVYPRTFYTDLSGLICKM